MNTRPTWTQRQRQLAPSPSSHSRNGRIPEIILEENELGRPHSPRADILALMGNPYDPRVHHDLEVHVTTGAGTAGEIILGAWSPGYAAIIPAKIYDITRLSQRGNIRLTAKATLNMEIWREHEQDWMNAIVGRTAILRDPGVINSVDLEYRMEVLQAQLYRKASSRRTQPELMALLTMQETVSSVLQRHQGALIAAGAGILAAASMSAMLGILIGLLTG